MSSYYNVLLHIHVHSDKTHLEFVEGGSSLQNMLGTFHKRLVKGHEVTVRGRSFEETLHLIT